MSEKTRLTLIIKSLQELLNSSSDRMVTTITQEGNIGKATCLFNEPISKKEFEDIIIKHNWNFPPDVIEFYLTHNGARMYTVPNYGGGTDLLSLDRILRIKHEQINIPDRWVPIAWTDHTIGGIYVDCDRVVENRYPYLYFLDAIAPVNEAIPIHSDFTTWLERLIICQGVEYWMWDFYNSIEFKNK
ncbi:SMI1/KNR4 family protein [Paenibacillus agilis]|uniref:SMI1/KNR4 family protein n=1 Tax=Paenibacillus agilis TaxID=3020863 RepID=A0A559J1H1_9BACL|nr:SMI1/KNR4 family protein [Paenibacillus agilis]TVX93734.1 SMI1/KNR4 family protein [Paenibacillus agilis]